MEGPSSGVELSGLCSLLAQRGSVGCIPGAAVFTAVKRSVPQNALRYHERVQPVCIPGYLCSQTLTVVDLCSSDLE